MSTLATQSEAGRQIGRRDLRRVLAAHPVAAVFLLAIAARAVVVAAVALRSGGVLFEDDANYLRIASEAARGRTDAWDEFTRFVYDNNPTFLLPIEWLFRLFGSHPVLAQGLVALMGALAAAAVTRLALEVCSRPLSTAAGAFVALLPAQVLFSSLVLKDAFVWAGLSALALLIALAGRSSGRRLLVLAAGAFLLLFLLGYLRQHTLVVAGWSLALTAWLGNVRWRWHRALGGLLLAVLVPLLVGAGVAGVGVLDRVGPLEQQRALGAQGADTAIVAPAPTAAPPAPEPAALVRAKEQEQRAGAMAAAAAAAVRTAQAREDQEAAARAKRELAAALAEARRATESLRQAQARAQLPTPSEDEAAAATSNALYFPRGLAVMLLRPYPWESIDNERLRFAQVENLVWYPVLLLALVGVLGVRHHGRVLAFPLVMGGGTAAMWALVEGNFGTAYRHRGEFIWAAAVLAAYGLSLLVAQVCERRGRRLSEVPPKARLVDAVDGR